MPSVYSFSRPRLWPSSTVMTPSLPTLSITSAMISPTSGSAALMAATAAICARLSTGRDCFLISATTASTAASMPRLTTIGLAPAVTTRRPSATIAWPSTTAVVVPSPATSSVLVATSLSSWAPMFSNGSSSSMSRAIVTPSLVMVGEPNFLSRTTLRPLGPIVTLTASASLSMPRLSERRAVSSKTTCLATDSGSSWDYGRGRGPDGRCPSVLDDRENVLLAHDEHVLAVDLELGAGVLRVQDLVADGDVHLLARPVLEDPARSDRESRPFLGLLLRGVRQDNPALGDLFARRRLDDDPIAERPELCRLGLGGQRVTLLCNAGCASAGRAGGAPR